MSGKISKNGLKWIAALRSGKYKQTREALEDKNGFCCLGVACKLAEEEGVVERFTNNLYISYGKIREHYNFKEENSSYLPSFVMDWLCLRSPSGDLVQAPGESLASMNDRGASFEEIANTIEKFADVLFDQNCVEEQEKEEQIGEQQ